VTQQTNDKEELRPAMEAIKQLSEELPRLAKLPADAGYDSKDNLAACEEARIEAYLPFRRESHHWDVIKRFKPEESNEAALNDI
jgi:hypothetical protein